MATYTVRSGDTWFSLAAKLGVDARTLKRQNRGTTLARGVVIRTGGATYTRPTDINPWGLGAGQVPAYAAGTTTAKRYLAAIGGAGITTEVPGVTPVTEEPGITPIGERPPAELAPQALMGDVEGVPAPGFPTAPTLGEPITMAGLTGADIGPFAGVEAVTPQLGLGPGAYPGVRPIGGGAPVSPPEQFDPYAGMRGRKGGGLIPEEAQLGLGPGAYPGVRPIGGGAPTPQPSPVAPEEGFVTQELPPARYPYGTTSAANYTARAMSAEYDAEGNLIREGMLPGAISPSVADMLGMSNEMLVLSGYVWDEASGLWHLSPQGTGTTTTTGGGGRGRIAFGRRGVGGGQSPYGSNFNSNIGGLINWRRGFGG